MTQMTRLDRDTVEDAIDRVDHPHIYGTDGFYEARRVVADAARMLLSMLPDGNGEWPNEVIEPLVEVGARKFYEIMAERGPTTLTFDIAYPEEQDDFRRVTKQVVEAVLAGFVQWRDT